MAKVDIHGTLLEYTDQGTGHPVVFVHGSASDYRTWKDQQGAFARRYRVVAYSRRYHWPNEPIAEGVDYSMSEHLDDLEILLRALDAAPAHLVGHSYGAFLALLLAIRRPALVRSLVLTEPPVVTLFVSNTPKPIELVKLMASRPGMALAILKFGITGIAPATAAAKRGDAAAATLAFGKAVLGEKAFSRLSDSRLEQVRANSFTAEFLGSGFSPLNKDQIRRVEAPTLLVSGQCSLALFRHLADALSRMLPRRCCGRTLSPTDPVVVINAFSQVFVVSVAEVIVCWALLGAIVERALEPRVERAGGLSALLVSAVLFGAYHLAHSAPFNTWSMVGLLTVVGFVTGTFFFVTRDVLGTAVFHNLLGTFGVTQPLAATGDSTTLEAVQAPLIGTALVTTTVLLVGCVWVRRSR